MSVRKSAVNSIRCRVVWADGSRYADTNVIQVTVHVGANRSVRQHLAFQAFLYACKRLKDVSDDILPGDRI